MEEVFDEYMVEVFKIIELLPRTAKFNFGEKFKESLFEIKDNLIMLYSTKDRLNIINLIDANVNTNRLFLRYLVEFKFVKKSDIVSPMAKLNTFAYFVGKYINYAKDDKR